MNTIAIASKSTDLGSVVGTVKWFDREKGYGFICTPGLQEDILLHANVLHQLGKSTTTSGATVSCEVSMEAGRFRVSKINLIEEVEESDLTEQSALTFYPARTKWFSKLKGYGFAVVFGTTEDIFVGQEALG